MVYVCIPVHNEAATIGPVLWKTRRVFSDAGRDFRVVTFDDASDDGSSEVLARYGRHVPLTVHRSDDRKGFACASERLLRWVVDDSAYPKRDFAVLLQADLTEDPADLLPMVKALEGGADLVASRPKPKARPRGLSGRLLRLASRFFARGPLSGFPGDPFASLRAYRVMVLKGGFELDGSPAADQAFGSDGWGANAEALGLFGGLSRRSVEISTAFRTHLRTRPTRHRPLRELGRLLQARKALKRRALPVVVAALAFLLTASAGLQAQDDPEAHSARSATALLDSLAAVYPEDAAAAQVSFGPGEQLSYRVELGWFDVGHGQLFVEGLDEVRGNSTYRAGLNIDGGRFGFNYKQNHTTFIDTRTLQSHRYLRTTDQTGYQGERHYEMYPEEGEWRREDVEDSGPLGSSLPLDDIAFIYYLRQMDLEVGKTYTLPRYFKEDGNPVIIRVLRRERREVDAGVFDCLVIEPVVQVEGMFAEGMEAEIYLSDDERRLLVYLRTDVPRFPGALELYLTDHRAGLPLNPEARARTMARSRLARPDSGS